MGDFPTPDNIYALLDSFPPPPALPPPPLDASDALEVALATPALDERLEGDSELHLSLPAFLLELMLRPLGVVADPLEGLFSGELKCCPLPRP